MKKLRQPIALAPSRRLPNWPKLLAEFIESRRNLPFEWGRQDCCLFACDGILSQSGLDPAAKMFRGKYRDALGAARLVRKHGGVEAIAAKVCAEHGWPEIRPAMAQRGDVVLLPMPHDEMKVGLGLCLGAVGAFTGASGLLFLPMTGVTRAWAVARVVENGGLV